MCAVRVGKVACYEHLIRVNIKDNLFHNIHIPLAEVAFFDSACLIERQVQKMNMVGRQPHVAAGGSGFSAADKGFQVEYLACVLVAGFLLGEKTRIFLILAFYKVASRGVQLFETADEIHKTDYLVVAYCDAPAGLVGDMYVMPLFDQAGKRAAHRDDIVVGVRRENKHVLGVGIGSLGTVGIVGIGLSAGPTRDGMLQVVEDTDIAVVCRPVQGNQFAQSVVVVVAIGQLQYRFSGLLAEPYNCTTGQLVVPVARSNKPRVVDTCQTGGGTQVADDMGVVVQL